MIWCAGWGRLPRAGDASAEVAKMKGFFRAKREEEFQAERTACAKVQWQARD